MCIYIIIYTCKYLFNTCMYATPYVCTKANIQHVSNIITNSGHRNGQQPSIWESSRQNVRHILNVFAFRVDSVISKTTKYEIVEHRPLWAKRRVGVQKKTKSMQQASPAVNRACGHRYINESTQMHMISIIILHRHY